VQSGERAIKLCRHKRFVLCRAGFKGERSLKAAPRQTSADFTLFRKGAHGRGARGSGVYFNRGNNGGTSHPRLRQIREAEAAADLLLPPWAARRAPSRLAARQGNVRLVYLTPRHARRNSIRSYGDALFTLEQKSEVCTAAGLSNVAIESRRTNRSPRCTLAGTCTGILHNLNQLCFKADLRYIQPV